MKKILLFLIVSLAAISLIVPNAIGKADPNPTEQLKSTIDKVMDIIESDKSEKEKNQLLWDLADERFDWELVAWRMLGKHWKKRTDEEKAELVVLTKKLVFKLCIEQLEDYSGEKFKYVDEVVRVSKKTGKKFAQISAEIEYGGEMKSIQFRMVLKEDQWMIYDVLIQGISIAKTYRSQFDSVIKNEGYEAMVEKLKEIVSD